jgi:hypothetical protein
MNNITKEDVRGEEQEYQRRSEEKRSKRNRGIKRPEKEFEVKRRRERGANEEVEQIRI